MKQQVWQLPWGTKVYAELSNGSEWFRVRDLDGSYVNAYDDRGAHMLVFAWEIVKPLSGLGAYRVVCDL